MRIQEALEKGYLCVEGAEILSSQGVLSLSLRSDGYLVCSGRGIKGALVHRLLLSPEPGETVDHLDGNPSNNQLGNLEVVSQRINNLRRVDRPSGVSLRGDRYRVSFAGVDRLFSEFQAAARFVDSLRAVLVSPCRFPRGFYFPESVSPATGDLAARVIAWGERGATVVYLLRAGNLWKCGSTANLQSRIINLRYQDRVPWEIEQVWVACPASRWELERQIREKLLSQGLRQIRRDYFEEGVC